MQTDRAVVLLSGGMDSAVAAAIMQAQGFELRVLSVDYGQRHRVELTAAARVASALGAVDHRVVHMDLTSMGGSALTDVTVPVPKDRTQTTAARIPITYVPARNTILLAIALGYAEITGSRDIVIGANQVDYSGYPDCRPAFLESFERLATLATRAGVEEGACFKIHAPLLYLSKADIVRRGIDLHVDFSLTHSCYDPVDDDGRPCRHCDACHIRARGFAEAGIVDPVISGSRTSIKTGTGSTEDPANAIVDPKNWTGKTGQLKESEKGRLRMNS